MMLIAHFYFLLMIDDYMIDDGHETTQKTSNDMAFHIINHH